MSKATIERVGSRISIAGEGLGLFQGKSIVAGIDGLETQVGMNDIPHGLSVAFGAPFDTTQPTMDSVGAIIRTLQHRGYVKNPNVHISVRSSIPVGLGLSSSSALLCALAKCFNTHFHLGLSAEELSTIAWEAERIDQGVLCGKFDYYPILYRTVLLQDFSQDPIKIQRLKLPADTTVILGMVGDSSRYGEIGKLLTKRFADGESGALQYRSFINEHVDFFVDATITKDKQQIGELIGKFHLAIRNILKIENNEIDVLVNVALQNGAYAAKTCGLRLSGGCMFALCDGNSAKTVQDSLQKLGATTKEVRILHE